MRHSGGIPVRCDQVCSLHAIEGFGEHVIRWVLAFWVAGIGLSETDKRRFIPSMPWGRCLGGVRCCSDGRGSTVPVSLAALQARRFWQIGSKISMARGENLGSFIVVQRSP